MQKFGWSRVAILQQAEEVFISVSRRRAANLRPSVFCNTNEIGRALALITMLRLFICVRAIYPCILRMRNIFLYSRRSKTWRIAAKRPESRSSPGSRSCPIRQMRCATCGVRTPGLSSACFMWWPPVESCAKCTDSSCTDAPTFGSSSVGGHVTFVSDGLECGVTFVCRVTIHFAIQRYRDCTK